MEGTVYLLHGKVLGDEVSIATAFSKGLSENKVVV